MEQNKSRREVGAFPQECRNVGTEAYKPMIRRKGDYLWRGDGDEVTEACARAMAGSPPNQARAVTGRGAGVR